MVGMICWPSEVQLLSKGVLLMVAEEVRSLFKCLRKYKYKNSLSMAESGLHVSLALQSGIIFDGMGGTTLVVQTQWTLS